MQQPKVPAELVDVIKSVAAEKGLSLAYDTHYDGFNWQIIWWKGHDYHRLDFQPWLEDKILISHITETYPIFPRLVRLLTRFVPFFPTPKKIVSIPCGELALGIPKETYNELVREVLANAA